MLSDRQKLAACAAYFASDDAAGDFDTIARAVPMEQRTEFVHLLTTLDALRLVRQARQAWRNNSSATLPVIGTDGDTVTLDSASIGHLLTWHRAALPQETQARIAYDSLIDRFLAHLAATRKIVALSVNDLAVWAFAPSNADTDLATAWDEFVKVAFSRAELEKSFVLLVNSVKLTDPTDPKSGFGYVHFPTPTRASGEVQAAFYFATLEQRVVYGSDEYKEISKAINEIQRKVRDAQKKNRADRVAELTAEIEPLRQKQTAVIEKYRKRLTITVADLQARIPPDTFQYVRDIARLFTREACDQFSKGTVQSRTLEPERQAKREAQGKKKMTLKNSIEDMIVKLATTTANFVLPCPLQTEMELLTVRKAGDEQSDICYACGRPLEDTEDGRLKRGSAPKPTANRFILAAPSQRLQSGARQDEPFICRACAAVAMVCPVKLTEGNVIVRLEILRFAQNDDPPLCHSERSEESLGWGVTDYLRMLTLGELNLVAGKYLLIKCTETVSEKGGRKPISDKMGALQYALFKVATILPRDTLRNCRAWLVTSGEQELPTRWMVWLNYLQEIFGLRLVTTAGKANFGLFDAVRLVQKEEVVKAVYALITADEQEATRVWWRAADGQARRNFTAARLLEDLRRDHVELLRKEPNMSEKATMFQHVAALTGLTQAFCYVVEREAKRSSDRNPDTEVTKLIEEVTDPFHFAYRTARNWSERWRAKWATMYNSGDNYFCFSQAKQLLESLGVDFAKRAEESKALFAKLAAARVDEQSEDETEEPASPTSEGLAVCLDDIANAYTWLFAQPAYDSEKKQKDFTTELRLSLASKFPQYFGK